MSSFFPRSFTTFGVYTPYKRRVCRVAGGPGGELCRDDGRGLPVPGGIPGRAPGGAAGPGPPPAPRQSPPEAQAAQSRPQGQQSLLVIPPLVNCMTSLTIVLYVLFSEKWITF